MQSRKLHGLRFSLPDKIEIDKRLIFLKREKVAQLPCVTLSQPFEQIQGRKTLATGKKNCSLTIPNLDPLGTVSAMTGRASREIITLKNQ